MVLPTLATAEGGPGYPEGFPLLPHPMEMLVGLVAFAILYWLYAKKVVPNLEKLYAERAAAIEGGMEQAEAAQAEAEAIKAQYQEQLKDARVEANQIREAAREQGAQIVADMRAQAQAEAARITETAHKQTEAERVAAAHALRSDVGRLSSDLASKIVGESLHDQARQSGIIDRFLAELEAGDIAPEKVVAGGGES